MKLVRYEIDAALCRRCGTCVKVCPRGAISQSPDHRFAIDQDTCDRCGTCQGACKLRAILRRKGLFL